MGLHFWTSSKVCELKFIQCQWTNNKPVYCSVWSSLFLCFQVKEYRELQLMLSSSLNIYTHINTNNLSWFLPHATAIVQFSRYALVIEETSPSSGHSVALLAFTVTPAVGPTQKCNCHKILAELVICWLQSRLPRLSFARSRFLCPLLNIRLVHETGEGGNVVKSKGLKVVFF